MASGMDDASGTIFNVGISQVCYTITETMDLDGNGFQSSICCFQIIVQDNESPSVICPLDVVLSTAEGICSAEYTWNHPDTSDNCSVSTLEVGYQNPDGSLENPIEVIPGMSISRTFEIGQSSITYIITDGSGNTNSCTWTVTVEDNEDPMISCIADTILYADMNCTYTQTGTALDAMVTDNCSDFELTHDYALAPNSGTLSGATFPLGLSDIHFIAVDAAGNSVSCHVHITVIDTLAPAFINCPLDTITVGTDVDNCNAFVNFGIPIAEDNCGHTVTQITGPASGSELAPGFYDVEFLAVDDVGNTDTCAFVIHVNDTQVPSISCPSNVHRFPRIPQDVDLQVHLALCLRLPPWEIALLKLRMKLPVPLWLQEWTMPVVQHLKLEQARYVIQLQNQKTRIAMEFCQLHAALM